MKTQPWRSAVASVTHIALFCLCVNGAHAAGTLYARAIGEPPEPEPRTAPTPPVEPGTPAPPESSPTETEGVKGSTILLGLGVAAALAALGGGGGGGGGGGSTTSH